MRLALKLVLAFVVANILLAAIYGYLAAENEVQVFEHTASLEAESLGPAMAVMVTEAYKSTGDRGMREMIRKASDGQGRELQIRWVWFDGTPGSPDLPAVSPKRLTAIAIQQHSVIDDVAPDGVANLRVYWPVHLTIDRRGGLEFSQSAAAMQAGRREIVIQTALLIGGMVLISGLLAAFLGFRVIGAPMRRIIEKTRHVAAGDLDDPLHIASHDELAELAESLNQMCLRLAESQTRIREETAARISALEQLRHVDRLKTVGRLAAGIAHELGTPLNVVAGRAGLILSGRLARDEVDQSAAAIKAEADKMTKIIRQLLDFARASTPRKTAVDLRPIVTRTIELLRRLAEDRKVQLDFAPGSVPAIAAIDAEQIQQVLTNLVVNAIQAMPQGGHVRIAIDRRNIPQPPAVAESAGQPANAPTGDELQPGPYYGLEVRDEGVGVAPSCSRKSSSRFSPPSKSARGPGWGSRSPMASSASMAAGSM